MKKFVFAKKILVFGLVCLMMTALLSACSSFDNGAPDMGSPIGRFLQSDENNTYTEIVENPFLDVTEETYRSNISLSVSTASYTDVRRQVLAGKSVSQSAVKIEEMVNYFHYDYAEPAEGKPLSIAGAVFDTPWNADTKLLAVGMKAEQVVRENQKHNLVLLIDVSGSMYGADRLGLVIESFCLLVDQLTEQDTVSIMTYASSQRVVLEGVSGDKKTQLKSAISDLEAGGSTAGGAAINKAYELAFRYKTDDNESIILIATDGDFNVGVRDDGALKALISENSRKGVHLSAIGVGMGNMRNDMLETIADAGDGRHMYFSTFADAKKALIEEIGGILNIVATDAKAQIAFNEDVVAKYRLLGYENRQLSLSEWEDDDTQAGAIGSGMEATAIYEIVLKKDGAATDSYATVTLRYKDSKKLQCEDSLDLTEKHRSVTAGNDDTIIKQGDRIFIAAVVETALLLRNSQYKGTASYEAVFARLSALSAIENDAYKTDFKDLVAFLCR